MSETVKNLLLGAAGSLLAVFVLWMIARGRHIISAFGGSRNLAVQLARGGFSAFFLSRADYHRRVGSGSLPDYLDSASTSIEIISISLRLTTDEGQLIELFRRKLSSSPSFRLTISLVQPSSEAVTVLAPSLGTTAKALRAEIDSMLADLWAFREALPGDQQARFQLLTHDCVPMGSAILLDAGPKTGRAQIETKLYKAPRTESFGFEVVGPSPFFERNYVAWQRLLHDSRPWTPSPASAAAR